MERSTKIRIWAAITILTIVVAAVWLGVILGRHGERRRSVAAMAEIIEYIDRNRSDIREFNEDVEKLKNYMAGDDKLMLTVMHLRNSYVDRLSLDTIYEMAIPALLSKLDPHSEYIPARDFDAVNEHLEGEFDGIGIVFNGSTDTIMVLNVIPQGPSDRAGVRAGDCIVRIDGRNVAGQKIAQDSMVRLMRGPRGSRVKLSIQRIGLDGEVEVEVERDAIEIRSIETAFMLDKAAGIGYIRLSQFARTSYDEITASMDKLRGEGMRSLILDLRGNSGGFLDQAIRIANEFLPEKRLIVYTEDRNGQQQRQYSNGRGGATDIALAILVDETSASSSEILAGAIQDNDRGLVLGRRTFGKGLVQSQIPFKDGSAIRLTVARYYTPTGRSIQKPYTNGDELSYHMEILNRYNNNEFFSADSIHFDDSMKFTTPGGRTVYGGGGIMPDIFIPLDTLGRSDYYEEVWNSNVLYRYTLDFSDKHRSELDAITSLDELDELLSRSNLVEDFARYASEHDIKADPKGLEESRHIIEAQLRAYIGRNTLSDEAGFYYNIYAIDDVMQRAVKELKSKNNKRR